MADPRDILAGLSAQLAEGRIVPYLGPEVLTLGDEEAPVPVGARALAHALSARVAVPGRIRNNLWHAAQYIETFRHRVTVDRLMAEFFKAVPPPTMLHRHLASLDLPLIVDTWYDGTMRQALAERSDWGQVQGASKARRLVESPWTRAYDASGTECPDTEIAGWTTLLYKPHGAAQPAGDVLASDADYVEVLTDIDLQFPIPPEVQRRRTGRSFLFLGCRFYDQILRTFARSIMRRSQGPHYAVVPEDLTKNELKFFAAEDIIPLPVPLGDAASLLANCKKTKEGP